MLQRNYITNFLITPMLFSTWLYAAPALININTATVEELDELPGIGVTKAEMIVSYRNKHGEFKSLEDLDKVPGIGPKLLEAISSFVEFGNEAVENKADTNQPAKAPINTSEPIKRT